jgi:hypothetical protein
MMAVLADIAISIRQLATLPKENNAFLFDYFLASGEDNNAKDQLKLLYPSVIHQKDLHNDE